MNKIELAKRYSKKYHRGQIRKKDGSPYFIHPYSVVKILKRNGYKKEDILVIAYLHDTVEDTDLTLDEIKNVFGDYISKSVYDLSRNKGEIDIKTGKIPEKVYRNRILNSNDDVKRVKLADMIHNTSTLDALSYSSIEKKIIDSYEFYIPLGKYVANKMVKNLESNIKKYFNLDLAERKYLKNYDYISNKVKSNFIRKIEKKYSYSNKRKRKIN